MWYTLRTTENGKVVINVRTKKKRKFLKKIRTINWRNKAIKIYLKVTYGKHINNNGKRVMFYNDGFYYNKEKEDKKDFFVAVKAFTEKSLCDEFINSTVNGN